jgi:hypothetical protein
MACNRGFGACALILWQSAARSLHSSGENIAVPQNARSRATRTTKPFGSGKETLSRRYSAPHAHLCPKLDAPSVRYSTQYKLILSWCCADHTLFGVASLSDSGIAKMGPLARHEKPRRRWGQGGLSTGGSPRLGTTRTPNRASRPR